VTILSMVPGSGSKIVDVEKGRLLKPGHGERDRNDDADHDQAEHDRWILPSGPESAVVHTLNSGLNGSSQNENQDNDQQEHAAADIHLDSFQLRALPGVGTQ
jgi:hypothetical protein